MALRRMAKNVDLQAARARTARMTTGSAELDQWREGVTGGDESYGAAARRGAEESAEKWRDNITEPARQQLAKNSAGVSGSGWDTIDVVLDNARLPRDEGAADGILRFNVSAAASNEASTITVVRRLAAVRSCRIMPFSWPQTPNAAMLTNRAEASFFIQELRSRATAGDLNVLANFRARLNAWEPAALLYYQMIDDAEGGGAFDDDPIVSVVTRSIGAQVEFYNDVIEMHPPVSLDTITLEVRRGDRPVNFLPFRHAAYIHVDESTIGGVTANYYHLSLTSGDEHNFELGQEIYFEQDVADTTISTTPIFAKNTSEKIALLLPGDVIVAFAKAVDPAYVGLIVSNVKIAVPARRVQISFQFSVARLDSA